MRTLTRDNACNGDADVGKLLQSVDADADDDDVAVVDGDNVCDGDDSNVGSLTQSVDANANDDAVVNGNNACVGDANVGLLMQSANANGKVANGGDACNDDNCEIADGGNARAGDANAVGMGRGSGARPRRLPILILRCIVNVDCAASWYVEEPLNW